MGLFRDLGDLVKLIVIVIVIVVLFYVLAFVVHVLG